MGLTLEEAIARVPGWADASDLKTTPLACGITNQNYRVDAGGESFLPPAPCHNDLLNQNFLEQGGQIILLDWESAGMGDIFFDLANFAVNHGLSEDEERWFLTCYFEQPTDAQWAHFKLMKILSDFREAMWGVVQIGISRLDFDFRGYANKHFNRLACNIQDPRWGEWLAALLNS